MSRFIFYWFIYDVSLLSQLPYSLKADVVVTKNQQATQGVDLSDI
jgi:hypothetical protein